MLQLGSVHKVISPQQPELISMSGMGRLVPTRGVMDNTEVNAHVLYDGTRYVALCVLDLVFAQQSAYEQIQAGIAEQLPNAHVMMTCIHDHSATAVPFDKNNPEHVAESKAAHALMIAQSIAAILEAANALEDVEVASTRAYLPQALGTNRRAKLDNGTCVTAWGAGPIIPPGMSWTGFNGPDADWVDILAFKKIGVDEASAVITSYGSHIHFYEIPMITSEAGGCARAAMREMFPQTAVTYATAYAGDVSLQFPHPMPAGNDDVLIEWQRSQSERFAAVFARSVAHALGNLSYQSVEEMDVREFVWTGDVEDPNSTARYVVQSLKLGDAVLCTLPGEMFLDFDEMLRAGLDQHIVVMGYNNSWLGYVATPMGFEEGSYECMRGPADKLGYGEAVNRVKGSTTTGAEIINCARQQIAELFA